MLTLILGLILGTADTVNTAHAAPAELWAGHQVVWGTANVPLIGERETRTDSYFLAHVERDAEGMHFIQETCRVEIAPVAGVRTFIAPETFPALPTVPFTLKEAGGRWTGQWDAGWTEQDDDKDGEPGVTVHVQVPLCSGRVFVSSQSETHAEARFVGANLEGEVRVHFTQKVLGASNPCLSLTAANNQDTLHGVVRYRPIDRSDTCAAVAAWPSVD